MSQSDRYQAISYSDGWVVYDSLYGDVLSDIIRPREETDREVARLNAEETELAGMMAFRTKGRWEGDSRV